MPPISHQGFCRTKDVPLGFEDGLRRVAHGVTGSFIGQLHNVRLPQHPLGKMRSLTNTSDLLRERSIKVGGGERRPLFGHGFNDRMSVASNDGIPQSIGVLPAYAYDTAMLPF